MNFIGPKSKKKASMQRFISRLYKSYEASFGDSPNAHAKALAKIQDVMKARRLSMLKNVIDAAQKKDGISRMKERNVRIRRLSRQAEDLADAIENKVISLSAANNGYVSVRKIHAELNKDALFIGSKAVVYEMLRQKGFFFRKIGDRWKLYRTKAIDERLNLSQIQSVANVSYSNMMEVKHSPVSKVEYRPERNGAAEEEDDDLESLFDGAVPKSETPPSEASDIPVAASSCSIISKDTDSSQLVEKMDVDLVKQESEAEAAPELEPKPEPEPIVEGKSSKEASEGPFEIDLKLLGLDLPEAESIEKSENGEISAPSALRDTGDDLDALMSKINDLVEDCMEPQAGGETAPVLGAVEEEVVEIPDDDMESEVVATKEAQTEISAEEAPEASVSDQEVAKVTNVSVIISNASAVEKMETDEDSDVVCIDSPTVNSNSNASPAVDEMTAEVPLTEIPTTVEKKADEEDESAQKKEQDAIGKCMTKAKRKETEKSKAADEDEVFLIEDDEDDLKRASGSVKPQDMREDIDDFDTESERAFQQEIEKEIEKDFDSGTKLGEKQENGQGGGDGEETSAKVDDKDMDIVCLDDSLEEPDDKEEEEEKQTKLAQIEGPKEKNESVDVSEPVRRESVGASKKDGEPEKVEEAKEAASDPAPSIEAKEASAGDAAPASEPKRPAVDEDDDVVILDDDDDEPDAMATASSEKKDDNSSSMSVADNESAAKTAEATGAETTATAKPSTIISDNSDNARDGVEEKEPLPEEKADKGTAVQHPSESNSSSSNLLKESTPRESDENLEFPPAKRIRLSQDETNSRSSTLSQEESKTKIERQDSTEDKENIKEGKKIKRVHSSDSVTSEFKKPKTEGDSLNPSKTEQNSSKKRGKSLPLYPPPNLDVPTVDLSLDFLKRFKKSIHKMNKTDLEELVLQKIVEAIVHKSEFSEMRDLIEKQEKVISGHRVKIAELTKQFRDLEMVHNRVLKDLETKNSQFIMPVKITRAVGLQVFFPNKKPDQPILPALSTPVQSPSNQPSRSSSTASVPLERSFSSPADGFTSNAVKQAPTNVVTPMATTPVQTPVAAPRRGCVQKLTPLRPDTPRNSPLNRAVPSNVVSSTTPSTVLAKEAVPKLLNRALAQKSRVSSTSYTASVAVEPAATPSPQSVAPSPPGTERLKQSAMTPPGIATKKTKDYVLRRYRPKTGQSDPQTVAHPLPPAATVVTSHVPPVTQPVLPAKAKRMSNVKPVIDLTEEDDLVPVTSTPKVPSMAVALPSATTIAPGPRYKVSVIPQQQLQQQPKPNPPKQTPQRPIAPNVPKQNGVALSIRQAPTNHRYRHPAPLPGQPIQSSNPAWKLPPARPTIRISNLESGIVISWTIEDAAKDKYAESTSYQIYAYQETSGPPLVESWRHVGDVKAMLLPMAVTLTQFQEGQRYYFAVRAVDAYNRCGPFSCAKTWS